MVWGRTQKFIAGVIIGCSVIGISYGSGVIYYSKFFYPNTIINGHSMGAATPQEICELLESEAGAYRFKIEGRDGLVEWIEAEQIGMQYEVTGLEEIKRLQNPWMWPFVMRQSYTYEVAINKSYDLEQLEVEILALSCLDPKETQEPVDAFITFSEVDKRYIIQPEEDGNLVDQKILSQTIKKYIEDEREEVDLEAIGCYVAVAIKRDQPALEIGRAHV